MDSKNFIITIDINEGPFCAYCGKKLITTPLSKDSENASTIFETNCDCEKAKEELRLKKIYIEAKENFENFTDSKTDEQCLLIEERIKYEILKDYVDKSSKTYQALVKSLEKPEKTGRLSEEDI